MPAGAAQSSPGAAPLNIGACGRDGSTAAVSPSYGRVDEAFVTNDVLSDDQVRGLYCAKLRARVHHDPDRRQPRRPPRSQRRGARARDFPTAPLRLHNFTGGALTDQGSGGVALTNNGGAVPVSGADGAQGGAFSFNGAQSLSATDAGLPGGLTARSYGCWFKAAQNGGRLMVWGTTAVTNDAGLGISSAGAFFSWSGADTLIGPFAADGQWHHAIAVDDNTAGDGVRRKLYLDGRLVGGSTVLNAITLGGANKFRVGADLVGTPVYLTGQIDAAFVCDIALPQDAISRLYAKGSQTLPPSVKNAGDHVEAMDATNLYTVFDTLDSSYAVDLSVSG